MDGKSAVDEHFSGVYDQLRRIAKAMLRGKPAVTLSATAIVHEAYARMAAGAKSPNVTEASFKRIATHVMREILCDAARRRMAQKRGGGDAVRVTAGESLADNRISIERILIVNEFLNRLQSISARQASVVELLFFGGLTIEETAAELEISVSTVERDWRAARAWLSTEVERVAYAES